jgi:PDZ domain
MTAHAIVNLLLEAGEDIGPPRDTRGVWAFGPYLPPGGAAFGSLTGMLQKFQRYGFTQDRGEDKIDELLGKGYTIIEKKNPREVQVYSKKLPLQVPAEAAEEIMTYLGLDKGTPVVYKKSYADRTGQTRNVENILLGTNEIEDERAAQAQQTAASEREKRVVHYRDRYGRPQVADPEEEGFRPRPQPPATNVTRPQEARGSLGFTYDGGYDRLAMNEQEKGVMVAAVHDGGPLAQAGVQAGDVIQTASYVDDSGQQKEYRIRSVANLSAVLAAVDPNSPIILYVRRGGQGHEVVVELQRPKVESPVHIPAAEVQAWARQQDQPKAQQQQQQQAQAPRQQPTTRQQTLRGWPRGRRPQRNLPLRPNIEPPASQTGNQPPNVSTLT